MALYLQATIVTYVSMLAERGSEWAASLHDDERGQDTLEWVLMSGLIAAGIVAVTLAFNTAISTMVANVAKCLDFDSASVCAPGF